MDRDRLTPRPPSPRAPWSPPRDRPSWRKPAGAGFILLLIVALCVAVSAMATSLATLPWWLQLPAYLVLGIVWIAPLKPLLRWMER